MADPRTREGQSASPRPVPLDAPQPDSDTAAARFIRWLCEVCTGLVLVGAFLPWRTIAHDAPWGSGIAGLGLVSAAAAVLAVLLVHARPLPTKLVVVLHAWLAAVVVLVALGAALALRPTSADPASLAPRPGWGIYVTLAAGGIWLVLALLDVIGQGRGDRD